MNNFNPRHHKIKKYAQIGKTNNPE